MSLGICVCWVGEHIFQGKCVPGTHISRDMCFSKGRTHITMAMCLLGKGTQITRDMCFLGRDTHVTSDMSSPRWETSGIRYDIRRLISDTYNQTSDIRRLVSDNK